jgi:AhpD family alkylhydroperoxidase
METTKSQTSATNVSGSAKRSTAQRPEVQNALRDLESTFGYVPEFIQYLTDASLPGAWAATKAVYFTPDTLLEPKVKDLICLAVAVQMPSDKLAYWGHLAADSHQASEQEQKEAVMISASVRQWSTVLNGLLLDKAEFKKETDKIMTHVKKAMEGFRKEMPPEETFLVNFTSAKEAYKDMEKTLGLVPKFMSLFPESGIAGAWSEFKGLQLNPYTALNTKQKTFIGLSVAAQIPCEYCVYFHRSVAMVNGATEKEIQEVIANAGLTRHWGAIFEGSKMDFAAFKNEADRMLQFTAHQQGQQLHS